MGVAEGFGEDRTRPSSHWADRSTWLIFALDDLAALHDQRRRVRALEEQLLKDLEFYGIVDKSPAMLEVFDFARKVGCEKFVNFSTDEVFGPAPVGVRYKEDDRYNAGNPYAATKAGSIQARRPAVHAEARKLGDGTFLVVYDNVKAQGDAEPRVVFDLVTQNPSDPKQGVLLTLGVPASDAVRGLKLMALLKQNMRINW